jgi:site-specific recombinase XerD
MFSSELVRCEYKHDCKQTFVRSILQNGTDIFNLAKLLGQEEFSVFQRYLKLTNVDNEKALRQRGQEKMGDYKT